MTKQWYVLAAADKGSELLRCTHDGFETVDLNPEAKRAFGTQLHNTVAADVAQQGGRYVPDGVPEAAPAATPRATFTNNDVRTRGADTEQHLRRLGDAVRDEMAQNDAPLFVAMDPAQFALLEAVSGLPSRMQRLDVPARSASVEQLFARSKELVR